MAFTRWQFVDSFDVFSRF